MSSDVQDWEQKNDAAQVQNLEHRSWGSADIPHFWNVLCCWMYGFSIIL